MLYTLCRIRFHLRNICISKLSNKNCILILIHKAIIVNRKSFFVYKTLLSDL